MSDSDEKSAPEELKPVEPGDRTIALFWLLTSLAVFALMIVLGITMRLNQGGKLALGPDTFYALMTMHGLGMAGSLFSAGLTILWLRLVQRCRPSRLVMQISYVLFLLGAVGLLAATLVGKFAAGWYALYPLPFLNATWPGWATGTTIISLMLMGVAWLLMQLDMLRAMAVRYGAGKLMAWHYFKGEPEEPLPSIVLIASTCTIAGALGTLAGAATLLMYLFKWQAPATQFDALLLKNLMFLFGHVIVNVAMYCGIGVVYDILPGYTGRPWKVNKLVAIAWNATLTFILFAYFHHLYMDFAQPTALHYFGQLASYGSAVPATAVTVFSLGSQLYRSGVKLSFTPLAFSLGIMGWVIGGLTAVLDSTIALNRVFHNTLWVPGHFHTYFLVGYILILLGYTHHELKSKAESLARASLGMMLVGGYTFLLMFFLGGLFSVPRRYATYVAIPIPSVSGNGTTFAFIAALAASLFLLGVLTFYVSAFIGRKNAEEPSPSNAE